jgi:HSP20 family protein
MAATFPSPLRVSIPNIGLPAASVNGAAITFGGQKAMLDPDNGAGRMNAGRNCAIEYRRVWIETMEAKFPSYWMWSEAFEMLARAERMHRQFFQPSGSSPSVAWEPPVDVLETERVVLVLVALPGVDFNEVKAVINQGELLISGCRAYPEEMRTAIIHRLELPQGRFERRIRLPPGRYSAIRRSDSNGTLLVTLEKAGASNG